MTTERTADLIAFAEAMGYERFYPESSNIHVGTRQCRASSFREILVLEQARKLRDALDLILAEVPAKSFTVNHLGRVRLWRDVQDSQMFNPYASLDDAVNLAAAVFRGYLLTRYVADGCEAICKAVKQYLESKKERDTE